MASSPYKPDDEEQDNYFHGFSGNPKLVARTGHGRWTKSLFESGHWDNRMLIQYRKYYMALDNLDIIGKWSKDLSMSIVTALGHCKWSYFFPIRTCLRDDDYRQEGTAATILLVAVDPASLEREDAIRIALSCRDIIRKFGIFDLEVEIMEGGYTQHAASAQLEEYFDHKHKTTSEKILPLLSYTGYPTVYLEDRTGQGTVGLHVKLGADESTVYGLTCRHVVCSNRAAHESHKPSAEDRQYHIQANATTFDEILLGLQSSIRDQEIFLRSQQSRIQRWDDWYQYDNPKGVPKPTEAERKNLASKQKSLAHNTRVLRALGQIVDGNQRQIGHLAFHPSFTISPEQQRGYLRDWALIELDPKKFTRSPDNSEDELEPWYSVAKRGAATGLTIGTNSGIDAVVRRPGYGLDGDAYTWELLIVPEKVDKFSDTGDSGSALFNTYGHVVGIVTGSNGVKNDGGKFEGHNVVPQDADEEIPASKRVKGTDITFAAPIKWVLDDIQDFTGQQVRLA
ncbi:hypothetical protein ANO14919_081440 [Xylariales sp. No.14919]|nr:hypothetical protein ANO14919_081440 [Xylariales sp. No.14919]